MRILIVGAGVVGANLAEQLSAEGQEVSIIDIRPELVENISERLDVFPVCGEGTNPAVLREALIDEAELIIAVTDSDHRNLILCLLAERYGVKTKIARVRRHDFAGEIADFLTERLGIARLIHPEVEVVDTLLKLIATPGAHEVADFADGDILYRGFELSRTSDLCGKQLKELKQLGGPPFLIAGVRRGDEQLMPSGDSRLMPHDRISVIIANDNLQRLLPLIGVTPKTRQRIVIAYANPTAVALAKQIEALHETILIEPNRKRCEQMSEELELTTVLHGTPTERSVLKEAGVERADFFISLHSQDEHNLMACLLAHKAGAQMVVPQTNTEETAHILDSLGLHATVDPRLLTVAAILRDVRRGRVLSMAKFGDNEAEAIEFEVLPKTPLVGKPLRDVKLPKGCLIGAVGRDGRVVIADGTTTLQPGDRALVFALPEAVGPICSLFARKQRSGLFGFLRGIANA